MPWLARGQFGDPRGHPATSPRLGHPVGRRESAIGRHTVRARYDRATAYADVHFRPAGMNEYGN